MNRDKALEIEKKIENVVFNIGHNIQVLQTILEDLNRYRNGIQPLTKNEQFHLGHCLAAFASLKMAYDHVWSRTSKLSQRLSGDLTV